MIVYKIMRWQSKVLFLMLFFPMVLVGILFSFLSMNELAKEEKQHQQYPIQEIQPQTQTNENQYLWPEERKRLEDSESNNIETDSATDINQESYEEEYAEEESNESYYDENTETETPEETSTTNESTTNNSTQINYQEYTPPENLEEIPIYEFQ